MRNNYYKQSGHSLAILGSIYTRLARPSLSVLCGVFVLLMFSTGCDDTSKDSAQSAKTEAVKQAPKEETKIYDLKFATPFSPKHTMQTKVFEPWAKKIAEQTKGAVKVSFFPGQSLGKAPEHFELAEKGIADISYTLQDYTQGRFPATSVFSLPFMTPTAKTASSAMWKMYEKFPEFKKEYDSVKLLALFCHPAADFHTVKKPIRRISDFKGMKIRTANPSVTEALKIFGAVPVTLPVPEAYISLERGVVDGTALPWEGVGVFRLDELVKYSTITDFYTMVMMVVMNKNTWDKLPNDIKKVIDENSGMALSEWAGRVYDETDEPFRQRALKKGIEEITLPEKEMQKLKDLTVPLREKWVKDMAAKGLPAQKMLDSALAFLKQG